MGCWCQNSKHSCPISGLLNSSCAPVWCCSTHTCLIDNVLMDAMGIVTGCLRPTPTDHLPIFRGIQPAELRRLEAKLSLAYCEILDSDHILYGCLSGFSDAFQRDYDLDARSCRTLLNTPCQTWPQRFAVEEL